MANKTTEKEKTFVPVLEQHPANIPINVNVTPGVYSRMEKLRKDKGFFSSQEVIRLALSFFLEKSGY